MVMLATYVCLLWLFPAAVTVLQLGQRTDGSKATCLHSVPAWKVYLT